MVLSLIAELLIAVAIQVIGYMLMPKPKEPKPAAVTDLQSPTSEAGRPIPVVFGKVLITGGNTIFYGEKSTNTYDVSVS